MRAVGLLLLVLGLLGLVFGALDILGLELVESQHNHATWPGAGPIMAGLLLAGFGGYLALRRA